MRTVIMVLLVEALLLIALRVVRKLIKGKISFFRGGYIVRKASYQQDERVKILVEDTHYFGGRNPAFRSLRVDNTNYVYSRIPLDKSMNMLMTYSYCAPVMDILQAMQTRMERALVLGGAGGTVPIYIAKKYQDAQVDVVEISGESIRICEEYFIKPQLDDPSRIRQIENDAKVSVGELEPSYQFIFCDLYVGGQVVETVYDRDFMNRLSALAGDDGALIINATGLTQQGIRVLLDALLAGFKFAWVMLLQEGYVAVASNRDLPPMEQLMQNSAGVAQIYPSLFARP